MRSGTDAQHKFSTIPSAEIQRSSFDRSHGVKTTFDGGHLVPVFADFALPGDTFNCTMHNFTRFATPIHPVMDNMTLDSFFFAVPIRLIWDNFQKFMGEQDNPGDSTEFLIPEMDTGAFGIGQGTLSDYLGIPFGAPDLMHSSLWHRAYNFIWNEWFRDENLQDSVVVDKDDGPDDVADYVLLRRGKRHDYFSSSLPWPQKGDAVTIPLGTTAPVISAGDGIPEYDIGASTGNPHHLRSGGALDAQWDTVPSVGGSAVWDDPKLEADLSMATAATINSLRQAFQVQKLYERDARGGTRYTEIVRAHFGVVSPDQRLQRPEYLGGGTQTINVTPVPQTSSTDVTSPQGNLSAYGTSSGSNHSFTKSFTEHCVIIGLVNVRADLNYQQGLPRMFSYRTKFDLYWPALAHIGEQAVLNKEIYTIGSLGVPGADDAVWGYQERYGELRYKQSMITGAFRSTVPTPLDTWHLAQHFTTPPVLDSTYIEDTPPIDRVIAVPSEPHFLFDGFFDLKCARPMPTYGVPGMIDHF